MLFALLSLAAAAATAVEANTVNPPVSPIRGVNLGGLFIVEPWMMETEWSSMGCSGQNDEWSCMTSTNGAAQAGFTSHWANWITEDDIKQIAAYGLNTVRIPVGHWIVEGTINSGEPWALGGYTYLKRLLGWCRDNGVYAILDLHGAPDAQTANQQFTGHSVDTPGFFNADDFGRARLWAWNITTAKWQDPDFASVWAIEVLNEPTSDSSLNGGMIDNYYPGVYGVIRDRENELGVSCGASNTLPSGSDGAATYSDCLHIQYMDAWWGAGDATTNLPAGYDRVILDNHRYFAYSSTADQTRSDVLTDSCNTGPVNQNPAPLTFGEFSLALSNQDGDFALDSDGGLDFYKQYIGSQIDTYENGGAQALGWTFWTWKNEAGYAWSYQAAVNASIIPTDASQIASQSAC